MNQQKLKMWIYIIIGLNFLSITHALAQNTDEQLLATANDIKQLVRENNTLTSSGNSSLSSINTNIAQSHSLLDSIKASTSSMADYITRIEQYVKEIYNWLSQMPTITDKNRIRYLTWKSVEDQANTQAEDLEKKLNNLIQYGVYDSQVGENKVSDPALSTFTLSLKRPSEIKSKEGTVYSTLSASTLLDKDVYENDTQRQAAEAVVQNAAGGNIPLPVVEVDQNTTDQNMLEYAAYQKTMSAIQSFAANNLVRTYAKRLPFTIKMGDSNITTSQAKLLKDINIEDPSDQEYWTTGVGSKSLIEQAFGFLSAIFSVNYSLNHITNELERINVQLALIMTQNTYLVKGIYGSQLSQRMVMTQQMGPGPLVFNRPEE